MANIPFFITIPHAGEFIPPCADWLNVHKDEVKFRDVDRFVDILYKPALESLKISHLIANCHRYAIDMNREPHEYDQGSVIGAQEKKGVHIRGLHWQVTTLSENLMKSPMSAESHKLLLDNYYFPFHNRIKKYFSDFKANGSSEIYHLDAHSMPSVGTDLHRDPGETRAEIVISDSNGTSCRHEFTDIVFEAYKRAGFKIKVNWPYIGGGVTQMHGQPAQGQHTLQVEIKRSLYMDENTKLLSHEKSKKIQKLLKSVLDEISQGIAKL